MQKLPPLLVVFDLDETLIHSRSEALPERRPDFWWAGYAIYLRPHVHELLVERFERGQVAIWTASDPDYAHPILERILRGPLTDLQHVFTREDCVATDDPTVPLKPLQRLFDLGADPARTIVVDNSPGTFSSNPEHGISVLDYDGSTDDVELLALGQRLSELDAMADVRQTSR
jgi:TFIIF-interacting CTD phosphatase-like protein